ncbi:unnamed protein product, partial [marine sediment metagenome]
FILKFDSKLFLKFLELFFLLNKKVLCNNIENKFTNRKMNFKDINPSKKLIKPKDL